MTFLSKNITLFFILLITNVTAQKEAFIPEVLKENQTLYELDIKYIGSTTDLNANYQYMIQYLVELLQENPFWTVHIRGHVCCGPSYRISKLRARNVYKILAKSGIDETRLSYKGYSDEKPLIFPEKTEEDELANRRVDFVITSSLIK